MPAAHEAVQIQDRGPVQPWEMRQMLKKACAGARQVSRLAGLMLFCRSISLTQWNSLFGQREHVFCADETCAAAGL